MESNFYMRKLNMRNLHQSIGWNVEKYQIQGGYIWGGLVWRGHFEKEGRDMEQLTGRSECGTVK